MDVQTLAAETDHDVGKLRLGERDAVERGLGELSIRTETALAIPGEVAGVEAKTRNRHGPPSIEA